MVVAVSLHASDRVLLFKIEIFDQLREQVRHPRHLLEAWEEAWLARDRLTPNQIVFHEWVVADVLYLDASFGICIEDFRDEIFALAREELWHLIVCTHDLFVKIGRLWVFEGKVACDHGVEHNT